MPELIPIRPIALIPTPAGCAVFLGDGSKTIVFYIDPAIGASIQGSLHGLTPPRPLSHDLYRDTLIAFGARVQRLVITRMEKEVYYARLIIEAENEVMERKIVELDCRPSDGIAVATRTDAPILVVPELWQQLEDVSDLLRQLQEDAPEGDSFPE